MEWMVGIWALFWFVSLTSDAQAHKRELEALKRTVADNDYELRIQLQKWHHELRHLRSQVGTLQSRVAQMDGEEE